MYDGTVRLGSPGTHIFFPLYDTGLYLIPGKFSGYRTADDSAADDHYIILHTVHTPVSSISNPGPAFQLSSYTRFVCCVSVFETP